MVKATFKGKREPIELEGDMILGTTIQYDAIRDSGRLSSVMLNFQFFREPWQEWRRRF